jgi:hypothetical protein
LIAGAVVTALALVAAAFFALKGAHRDSAAEERADREHPIVTAPRIAVLDGRSVVRLDSAAAQRAGIRTESVRRGARPESMRAFATVSDLQPLAQLSASYATAMAQAQTAHAKLAASRAEYERSRQLFDDQQNVSATQLQSSQAAFLADQATLAAAQAQVDASLASVRLGWGSVLADALAGSDSRHPRLIDDLLARRQTLLQVTLPSGQATDRPPPRGRVVLEGGGGPPIEFLAPAAHADPRLSGRSFYYRGPPDAALLPGVNLMVQLPTGRSIDAALIPASALVWWQGRAWVFIRTRERDFARREISVDVASSDTDLLADLDPGTEVVVQGAQVLLSEELRAENFSTDVGGR